MTADFPAPPCPDCRQPTAAALAVVDELLPLRARLHALSRQARSPLQVELINLYVDLTVAMAEAVGACRNCAANGHVFDPDRVLAEMYLRARSGNPTQDAPKADPRQQ